MRAAETGLFSWDRAVALHDVIGGNRAGRTSLDQVVLVELQGIGIEDGRGGRSWRTGGPASGVSDWSSRHDRVRPAGRAATARIGLQAATAGRRQPATGRRAERPWSASTAALTASAILRVPNGVWDRGRAPAARPRPRRPRRDDRHPDRIRDALPGRRSRRLDFVGSQARVVLVAPAGVVPSRRHGSRGQRDRDVLLHGPGHRPRPVRRPPAASTGSGKVTFADLTVVSPPAVVAEP